MVDITFCYEDREQTFSVEKVIAPLEGFNYWVVWHPKQEDGRQEVQFVSDKHLTSVIMLGEPEEEKADLKVVPFERESST